METYSEEEQIAIIKDWWKEYGMSVVIGVVLAVSSLGGWKYWQHSQTERGESASAVFYEMMEAYSDLEKQKKANQKLSSLEVFTGAVTTLKSDFESTEYAQYAALQNARYFAEENKLDEASNELQWILDQGPNESLRLIASLRLTRVLLAQDKLDAALVLASTKDAGTYESAFNELRGDILLKQGNVEGATKAYKSAMDKLSGGTDQSLEMKYYNLLGRG